MIFWSLPMKSTPLMHILHSGLSISVVSDSSQIFTKYRSHPPCVVSWSRWWINCICRSSAMSIFVFVCTSSSRLAVRQLKAAFILAHLIQESSCNSHVIMITTCAIVTASGYYCFRKCVCIIYAAGRNCFTKSRYFLINNLKVIEFRT